MTRATTLGAVVRQQLLVMLRDRRFLMMACVLGVIALTALAASAARNERLSAERAVAARADAHAWQSQGDVNPHSAAHFGQYVFKPVSPLSAIDPGALEHLGTLLRLEAHKQSPASARPSDSGTALTGFSSFSVAFALQTLAPLLLIAIGFMAFSGQHARQLLSQELGAGVDPRALVFGRLCAFGVAVVAIVLALAAAGSAVLIFASASHVEFLRLLLMLAGYGLYLFAFLAITLGVSALSRSARGALVSLLAFWTLATLLVPRIAPDLADRMYPTPPAPQFEAQVQEGIEDGLDGHDPRHERLQALREATLQQYGVTKLEDLPINFGGVALQFGESSSTEAYRLHFDRLHRIYARQGGVHRAFGLLSPLPALQSWSQALAGNDLDEHLRFAGEAEEYRFGFVQELNRHMLQHPRTAAQPVRVDAARATAGVDPFRPSIMPLSQIWERQWSQLLTLLAWCVGGLGLAWLGARKLRTGA